MIVVDFMLYLHEIHHDHGTAGSALRLPGGWGR